MSNSVKNILVKRLKASDKRSREKTPGTERIKLVPISSQSRSSSELKKTGRLDLVSPFFGRKNNGTLTDRTNDNNTTPITIETSTSCLKKIPAKLTRLKHPHVHGSSSCVDKNSKLLDFISKIRGNNSLHDDFWYFNRGQNAYDMKLTTFANKNLSDYFTLSYRGVAHFYKDEVYFLSLEEWERENYYHNKLMEISFFKRFLKLKVLKEWIKLRRLRMMENRRCILEGNLSFLDEDMQESLLAIREKIFTLTKIDVVKLQAGKIKSMDEFSEEQRQKIMVRLPEINNLLENIVKITKASCDSSMDKFLRLNVQRSLFDKDENHSNKILPYTNQAVSRFHCQILGKFIRLIEYMEIQAKITMCISNYSRLYNYVSQNTKILSEKKALLIIDASFTGSTMNFSPELSKVLLIIRQDIKKNIKTVLSFELLENHSCFEKYIRSLTNFDEVFIPTDLKPELFFMLNPEISNYRVKLRWILEKSLKIIADFGKTWKPHFKIYRKNSKFKLINFAAYSNENLFKIIRKYKDQIKVIKDLPEYKDIQIFRINLSNIKSKLLSSSKTCLKTLKKTLINLAIDRSSSLLNELSSINKKLFELPKANSENKKNINILKHMEELTERADQNVVDFMDFIEILENNKIPLSQEVKNKSIEIYKAHETMKTRINYIFYNRLTTEA